MDPYLKDATEEENEFAKLVAWLYGTSWGTVGGPLHIVLDDHNLEDAHIQYCAAEVKVDNGFELTEDDVVKCKRIIEILLKTPFRERLALMEHAESLNPAWNR